MKEGKHNKIVVGSEVLIRITDSSGIEERTVKLIDGKPQQRGYEISIDSPIGDGMLGKYPTDKYDFTIANNNIKIEILEIVKNKEKIKKIVQ